MQLVTINLDVAWRNPSATKVTTALNMKAYTEVTLEVSRYPFIPIERIVRSSYEE